MKLRVVATVIKFLTIQFAAAQQLAPDATVDVQDHGGAPDIATLPIVTATAPAITPRPTHKYSSPLPQCVLECLQKAVDSSGCGKCVVPVAVSISTRKGSNKNLSIEKQLILRIVLVSIQCTKRLAVRAYKKNVLNLTKNWLAIFNRSVVKVNAFSVVVI